MIRGTFVVNSELFQKYFLINFFENNLEIIIFDEKIWYFLIDICYLF